MKRKISIRRRIAALALAAVMTVCLAPMAPGVVRRAHAAGAASVTAAGTALESGGYYTLTIDGASVVHCEKVTDQTAIDSGAYQLHLSEDGSTLELNQVSLDLSKALLPETKEKVEYALEVHGGALTIAFSGANALRGAAAGLEIDGSDVTFRGGRDAASDTLRLSGPEGITASGSAASLTLESGRVTAAGTDTGLYAQAPRVTIGGGSGTLYARGSGVANIYAAGSLTVTGGTVTADGSDPDDKAGLPQYGIFNAKGDLSVTGGKVSAAAITAGILSAGSVRVSGDAESVTAKASGTEGDAFWVKDTFSVDAAGVSVQASGGAAGLAASVIDIRSGNVRCESTGTTYSGAAGMAASDSVRISGGTVYAAAVEGTRSKAGIEVFSRTGGNCSIEISGGDVTARGWNAVYAASSGGSASIVLSGGHIIADARDVATPQLGKGRTVDPVNAFNVAPTFTDPYAYLWRKTDAGSFTEKMTAAYPWKNEDTFSEILQGCAVSYDANGGTGEMKGVVLTAGSTYELPENTFTAPAYAVFDKWDVNGTLLSPGSVITVDSDTVVKASWKHAHALKHVDRVDPTCTEAGREAYWQCEGCGKIFADEAGARETTLDALMIAPAGHKWKEAWSRDASSHWQVCAVCGAVSGRAPHTFGDWEIVREATADRDGVRTKTCATCGYAESEVIPKTGKAEDPGAKDLGAKKEGAPATGDRSGAALWAALLAGAALAASVLTAGKRRVRDRG